MDKPTAFVMMSFAAEEQATYRLIKRVLEQELGWRCLQINESPGAGNLTRALIEGIINATLVIVNLTALDGDALYGLGVAHALGNNVLTLHSGDDEQLPFNLKNYRRIRYENSFDGAEQLAERLRAAVQALPQWGHRPSNPVQDFLPIERRSGPPVSDRLMPTVPDEDACIRELGYTRELASVVRQRLHYVQIAQLQSPAPGLDVEAARLTERLQALRAQVARLEQQCTE